MDLLSTIVALMCYASATAMAQTFNINEIPVETSKLKMYFKPNISNVSRWKLLGWLSTKGAPFNHVTDAWSPNCTQQQQDPLQFYCTHHQDSAQNVIILRQMYQFHFMINKHFITVENQTKWELLKSGVLNTSAVNDNWTPKGFLTYLEYDPLQIYSQRVSSGNHDCEKENLEVLTKLYIAIDPASFMKADHKTKWLMIQSVLPDVPDRWSPKWDKDYMMASGLTYVEFDPLFYYVYEHTRDDNLFLLMQLYASAGRKAFIKRYLSDARATWSTRDYPVRFAQIAVRKSVSIIEDSSFSWERGIPSGLIPQLPRNDKNYAAFRWLLNNFAREANWNAVTNTGCTCLWYLWEFDQYELFLRVLNETDIKVGQKNWDDTVALGLTIVHRIVKSSAPIYLEALLNHLREKEPESWAVLFVSMQGVPSVMDMAFEHYAEDTFDPKDPSIAPGSAVYQTVDVLLKEEVVQKWLDDNEHKAIQSNTFRLRLSHGATFGLAWE
eukprot:869486_1